MKTIHFFFALLFLSQNLSAQTIDNKAKNGKWLLETFLSIDRSNHYNGYAERDGWGDIDKEKINTIGVLGLGSTINYIHKSRFTASIGLALDLRKFNTHVFLNQRLLPPSRRSFSKELVNTKSISYLYLRTPVSIGFQLIQSKKYRLELYGSYTLNILLNAKYKNSTFTKYDGWGGWTYLSGHSIIGGIKNSFSLSDKYSLLFAVDYSFKNKEKVDPLLLSQWINGSQGVSIEHEFYQLRLGVGIKL